MAVDDDRPGDEAKFTLPPPAGAEVAVFRSRKYGPTVQERDWGGPDELDAAFAGSAPPVRAAIGLLRRDQCLRMLDRAPLSAWVTGRALARAAAESPRAVTDPCDS